MPDRWHSYSRKFSKSEIDYIRKFVNDNIVNYITIIEHSFSLSRKGYTIEISIDDNKIYTDQIVSYMDNDDWFIMMILNKNGSCDMSYRFDTIEDFCNFLNENVKLIKK